MKKTWRVPFIALLLCVLAGWWAFSFLWPAAQDGDMVTAETEITEEMPMEGLTEASASAPSSALNPVRRNLEMPQKNEYLPSAEMPSQLNKIEGIRAVAPRAKKEEKKEAEDEQQANRLSKAKKPLQLNVNLSDWSGGLQSQNAPQAAPAADSHIAPIMAPVKHRLIRTEADYKAFKTKAQGGYPAVDFSKNMLVVLESDSNLPDKVFEIRTAEIKDGKLTVVYAVNVLGLDQKINSHSVKAVKKTDAPVELKQIL